MRFETLRRILILSTCMAAFAGIIAGKAIAEARSTLVETSSYTLELYSSIETVGPEALEETSNSNDKGPSLEELAKRPDFIPWDIDSCTKEVHEIRQRFRTGDEHVIWKTVSVIPDFDEEHVASGLYQEFDALNVSEVWSLSGKHYILCNAGWKLLLVELQPGPDGKLEANEHVLRNREVWAADGGALFASTVSDELSLWVDYKYSRFAHYSLSSGSVTNGHIHHVSTVSYPGVYVPLTILTSMMERMSPEQSSTVQAERMFRELIQFDSPGALDQLDPNWGQNLDPLVKNKLMIKLFNGLLDKSVIAHMPDDMHAGWTRESKRCLIGLWHLLDLQARPVASLTEGSTRQDRFEYLFERHIRDGFWDSIRQALREASLDERLEYAKYPSPSLSPIEVDVTLVVLSYDDDPAVRKAVIENLWTNPFVVFAMMQDEKDPEVLAALEAYSKVVHMMPPEDERPMPPGW